MRTDYDTPDGFHVGTDGVWDGNATTVATNTMHLGPGAQGDDTPEETQATAETSAETTESTETEGTVES